MCKVFDFDQIINRYNTDSFKYDMMKKLFGKSDLIPLWVADMEFATPKCVIDEMYNRLKHPIFSYTLCGEDFYNLINKRMQKKYGVVVHRDWIVQVPGVVPALAICVYAFSNDNQGVVIQPPVYGPFAETIVGNNRRLVENNLIRNLDGSFSIDFNDIQDIAINPDNKMMIICNPHNPVGRIWNTNEIVNISNIFTNNFNSDKIIIEDAIHCDIVYPGEKYTPLFSINQQIEQNSITIFSASKTFNIAGLNCAYCIIPNAKIRRQFIKKQSELHLMISNIMGVTAQNAAYRNGQEWENQLVKYIYNNYLFLNDFVNKYIPQIKVTKSQATFLNWLDCSQISCDNDVLKDFFVNKCGVALNSGVDFGSGGAGFQRINIGCPKSMLLNALENIANALNN
ncbi:MAG: pyridoxal phosphate-dependent aminotransferase [Bacteroidales bacterium]|nr:pyridoxal phosphate-dependent aminotransferase [Bacteroidales bacterium]